MLPNHDNLALFTLSRGFTIQQAIIYIIFGTVHKYMQPGQNISGGRTEANRYVVYTMHLNRGRLFWI